MDKNCIEEEQKEENKESKEPRILQNRDPSILEINVHDAIKQKDVGPGQGK